MSLLDEWIEKAEADYKSAVALQRRRKEPLPDIICYHCQQCVEKYLKAYLIAQGSTPPRIHDLEDLLNLCALSDATLTARLPLVQVLNPYGVLIRYPGMTATVAEAQAAIGHASPAHQPAAHTGVVSASRKGRGMTLLQEAEQLLAAMSRAEKAQLLQWVVQDLGDAFPGIESVPGVCGGDPCIVRTRIPVWVLEHYRRLGADDGNLLRAYPVLRATDLANAWAYVRSHRDEIEQQIRVNEDA